MNNDAVIKVENLSKVYNISPICSIWSKIPFFGNHHNLQNHLIWALNETHWKIRGPGGAAELLDMHYSTLRSRIKKHGIKKQLLTVS